VVLMRQEDIKTNLLIFLLRADKRQIILIY